MTDSLLDFKGTRKEKHVTMGKYDGQGRWSRGNGGHKLQGHLLREARLKMNNLTDSNPYFDEDVCNHMPMSMNA